MIKSLFPEKKIFILCKFAKDFFCMRPNIKISPVFVILFFILFIVYSSCRKKEVYPIIPYIEFKDYFIKSSGGIDSSIMFIFTYKDGDGDIGYPDEDMEHKSVFVYYYKKNNGVYYLRIDPEDSVNNFNVKLPMLLNSGSKRPIKGEIEYSIDISLDVPVLFQYDTVYVEFYLMDRALNKSNTIASPEIVLKRKNRAL